MMNVKFDFDDILLKPATSSTIRSRSDIDIYTDDFLFPMLPIISAPMDRVYYGDETYINLSVEKVVTTVPRSREHIYDRLKEVKYKKTSFVSISLSELININSDLLNIKSYVEFYEDKEYNLNILVDMANGHIAKLEGEVTKFKDKYPEVILMVGNVANPVTYRKLSDAGADFVRVSIGSGSACLTSQQTAIGYPMASLIEECYHHSFTMTDPAKIVADGGFKKYSDIIKALALGADYVMLGSVFNRAIDIGGDVKWGWFNIKSEKVKEFLYNKGFKLKHEYRGMSTKEVQKDWGKTKLKTSEGITKYNDIEYTVEGWLENFSSYLRSAMSYTNSNKLDNFKGVDYIRISDNSHKRFKK